MKKIKKLSRFIVLPTLCFTLLASSVTAMAERTESTPYPDTFIYGDFNGDYEVDSGDYNLMKPFLLGKFKAPANADLNLDGVVDSADYTILRRYLLGIIDYLPYTSSSNGFSMPCYKQPEGSNWCWATATQSIIAYYRGVNSTPSVENIVRKAMSVPDYVPISSYLSYGALYDRQLKSLQSFGITGKTLSDITSGLDITSLKKEINAKRPIQAAFKLDNVSAAHVIDICGYAEGSDRDVIMFMDPQFGHIYGMEMDIFYRLWKNGTIYNISPYYVP